MIVKPYCPNLGATVTGIDLSKDIDDQQLLQIKEAFLKYHVLFFQEQKEIKPELQIKLGQKFGKLHMHPAAPTMLDYPEIFEIHADKNSKIANGEFWHSDVSCDLEPPLGTMLQLQIVPQSGGDTMFANMNQAYERLSDHFKKFLTGLSARHESEHIYRGRYSDRGVDDTEIEYPKAIHPIIRTHPDTKQKSIFVNRTFTTQIEGLTKFESDRILEALFTHCEHIDFQIRYKWHLYDLVFWDNRCTMHRAIWDYWPMERKGRRVTIEGTAPI
ncbi:MAG: TauD/TfdA family dioxygenase [Pseudomonadota bacterium]|nr:TauD/TfdA family dioxygenase [Pseudomonadota bacterium]